MARSRYIRRNTSMLRWVRAVALAVITAAALLPTGFTSPVISLACSVAIGVIALYSAPLASLLMIAVIGIPVLAADLVVGVLFLVIGFGTTQYLGDHQARGFIVVALAALAVVLHAEWAVIVLAGYLLGSGQGAIAAIVSCILIQLAGVMLGQSTLGTVITGGSAPAALSFASMPASPLSFSWLGDSIRAIDTPHVIDALTSVREPGTLAAQAATWGAAAALTGLLRRPVKRPLWLPVTAAAAAVLGLATVTIALSQLSSMGVGVQVIGLTTSVSLILVVASVIITERFFQLQLPESSHAMHGVRAEDADVDELLSTIASAEKALVSRHTAHAVVLITDMKSFSAMTEDIGSVESAKLVQRHRDLLLPVIDAHGGSGKSTGGDGLVAAFKEPAQAIAAAITMQRAVEDAFGDASPVAIRIGIAQGEVVLDKRGRPFIGAALNLAARVMDLADGGRIMVESAVADSPHGAVVHDHGSYRLKNIQDPVGVYEVLWRQDMKPSPPRGEVVAG